MKNAVLWDVTQWGSYKNQLFGGTYRVHHQGDKIGELGKTLAVTSNRSMPQKNTHIVFLCSMLRLLPTASIVPSWLINVTLMTVVIHSTETSSSYKSHMA
jgi:hypothetical protein